MQSLVELEPRPRRVELPERGGEVAFLDFGPPDRPVDVVFSHANGFNAWTYRTILRPLAREMRILAPDLRGHGASSLPTPRLDWPGWTEYQRDLQAFLARQTEGPVVLAGHSMGGTISLLTAAAAPDRARALVLYDPVLMDAHMKAARDGGAESPIAAAALKRRSRFPSKQAALQAYRGRGAFRTWSEAQLADYIEAGFRQTEAGDVVLACAVEWEATNYRIHNYDPWAAFRAARCPILLVRAEHDTLAQAETHVPELLANGRIEARTIPGTTHFLPMERPDLVRETLREALSR